MRESVKLKSQPNFVNLKRNSSSDKPQTRRKLYHANSEQAVCITPKKYMPSLTKQVKKHALSDK